jgi:hypothetical protein
MPSQSDWALIAPLNFDRALMRNSLTFAQFCPIPKALAFMTLSI